MKRVIRSIFVIFVSFTMLFFSSCSLFDFVSVGDLLKAPKLTGENAELQKAFEDFVGNDVSLLSPLSGNYRSAYIRNDIDYDGAEEAIVFYCADKTDRIVHINLLKKFEGQWRSVADIAGNGSEVYKVEFLNIDNKAENEIIVTWTVADTKKDKSICIYKIDVNSSIQNNIISPIVNVNVFDYILTDVDSDGYTDFFYLYYDSAENRNGAYLKLLKYTDDTKNFIPESEIKLAETISSVISLKYDICEDVTEIFVDCMLPENVYVTDIVLFDNDNNSLSRVFSENEEDIMNTKRTSLQYCADINDDGLIEIPVELFAEESYSINTAEGDMTSLSLIDWQRYKNNSMISLKKYYVCPEPDIKICVNEVREFSYIVYNAEKNEIQFHAKNKKKNNTLFTIRKNEDSISENIIEITSLGKKMNINESFVKSLIE